MRAVARLHDQTDQLAASLKLPADPASAEHIQHFYRPRSRGPHSDRRPQARTLLRVPKVLEHVGGESDPYGSTTARGLNGATPGAASYAHVKRWDELPKSSWLQAVEAGHTPGPVYREMSFNQAYRPFGSDALGLGGAVDAAASPEAETGPPHPPAPRRPLSGTPGGGARQAVASLREADSAPAASRPQPSVFIGAHYSPGVAGVSVRGLEAAAAADALPVGAPHDEPDEAAAAAALDGPARGAASFLPLELFDEPGTEPCDRAAWAGLSKHTALPARSRYRTAAGDVAWAACDVFEHDAATDAFQISWVETQVSRPLVALCVYECGHEDEKFPPRETPPHTRTARARPPAAHRRRHSPPPYYRHGEHSPTGWTAFSPK